jgi:hypothetical protein
MILYIKYSDTYTADHSLDGRHVGHQGKFRRLPVL